MKFIRQGATHKVVVGPAVAVGDGFTPVTTLALSSADEAEAILHDNGTVVDLSGYTWAAITTADGYYHLTLQSGISNTVGHLTVVINDDSLCLPLREDFMVLEEAIYDALFASGANAFTGAAGSTTITALATGAITAGVIATDAIDADALATDAVQEIRNAITGGAYALDTDANGRIRIVDGTGAGELNTSSGSVDVATIEGSDATDQIRDAVVDDATRIDASALNALTAVSNITSLVISAGGAVDCLVQGFLNNTIAETTADNIAANFETFFDNGNALTSSIIDDLENVAATLAAGVSIGSGGITSSSFASGAIDAAALATDAAQEIRNAITGGAYALDTDANGRVRVVDGTGAGELSLTSGLIDGIAGTIQTLDALDTAQDTQHSTTQSAISGLNNLSAAQVNAEVVDALNTDTYAEPGQGAPGATISLAAKIGYLYKAWRNKKTSDSTTDTLFADDGSTADQKSTKSDDGSIFTSGEWTTGA